MVNFKNDCPKFCYRKLFQNCASLIKAPLMPALTLEQYCYAAMYSNTSIQKAPELPAMTLGSYSYSYMFESTPIVKAPELPALNLKSCCYQFMFYHCSNLIKGPIRLNASTLVSNCYNSMFKNCYKLEKAPELMFTTVIENSCNAMFENCSKLSYIKVHFLEWGNWSTSSNGIYNGGLNYWLSHAGDNVIDKVFICPQNLPEIRDNSHILENWTIERF